MGHIPLVKNNSTSVQVRSPLSNIINMEGGSGDNAEDDKDDKEASDPQPKRMVDFEQKNLERLEALKA